MVDSQLDILKQGDNKAGSSQLVKSKKKKKNRKGKENKQKKKERKKKLSGAAVVCVINKICDGENQPQKILVKNRKNSSYEHIWKNIFRSLFHVIVYLSS